MSCGEANANPPEKRRNPHIFIAEAALGGVLSVLMKRGVKLANSILKLSDDDKSKIIKDIQAAFRLEVDFIWSCDLRRKIPIAKGVSRCANPISLEMFKTHTSTGRLRFPSMTQDALEHYVNLCQKTIYNSSSHLFSTADDKITH